MKLVLRPSKAILFLLSHMLLAAPIAKLTCWGGRTESLLSLLSVGILDTHKNTSHHHWTVTEA